MAQIQWIKLKVDMFDNEKIKLIEAMPDADSILVIWVKLLTYAGKVNSSGYIMLTENIPMNEEELATIFNRPLNTIRYALQVFERYGMVERDNDSIKIKNWDMHQNVDGMDKIREQNRIRQQEYRKRLKEEKKESNDSNVTSRDSNGTEEEKRRRELEEDKEIDIEKEGGENNPSSPSIYNQMMEIFQKENVQVDNPNKAFNISKLLSNVDDMKYLNAAIEIAEDRNASNTSYILGIIKRWHSEGIKTYSDLEESEEKNKEKKESFPGQSQYQDLF